MKFSKTLATSFVAIAALIFASIPAHAAPGDTFIDIRPARGESAASVFENGGPVGMSIRQAVRNAVSSGNFESWICRTGVDEKNCNPDEPKTIYTARQLLPYCAASSQENCIEEVAFAKQDGPFVPAKFIRTTDVNPLPEIADQGLWAASGLSLFKAADDSTDGGQLDFAVAPAVNLRYSNQSKMWESYSLESGLYAYRLSAPTSPRYIQDSTWADGTRHMQTMGDPNCIWSDSSACGIQQDLSNGTRIRLTLRVSNSISGWFRGRITKPDIQLTKFSDKNNRIVIAANPVEVSRMTAILNAQNSTKEQQDAIKATGGNGALGSLFDGENKGPHSTWGDFGWVEMFRDLAKDTAIATTTTWNFSTIETRGNNNCLNDTSRVLGIVSTNATMYNGVVPRILRRHAQLQGGGHALPARWKNTRRGYL